MFGKQLNSEMTVVRPLRLTDKICQPQFSNAMAGHTTKIASKIECRKYFKENNRRNSPPYFLLSWLHIARNAFFKSSVVMFETALFDTHRNKSSGTIPTQDGWAYRNNCIKERVPKIFRKKNLTQFFHQFFDKLVAYWHQCFV